ncbi:MAG: helix-turn-helix domain-containing protein, partial [Candidatus Micrarchaeota archaeon]
MVQDARRYGISEAARMHSTTRNTVRKWLRRYDGSLASLGDHSKAPHNPVRMLAEEDERRIVAARKKLPPWGARRLKIDFALPYSVKTIRKVIKKHGLARRWRRKKHETKRCLRAIKRGWEAFQQMDMDTKDLCDIPEYWAQAKLFGLPAYQYTARDVSTGALFLGFADELSLTYAELFAERIMSHLSAHGIECGKVTVQTDNGSEFVGSWQAKEPSAFTRTVERHGAVHRTIPPGAHRFQADIETVHALMETEFYLERFYGRDDFLEKAAAYQLFFNYIRKNSGKESKCPFDLLEDKDSTVPLDLLDLPPVFLEDLLHERLHPGYHVGYLPSPPPPPQPPT